MIPRFALFDHLPGLHNGAILGAALPQRADFFVGDPFGQHARGDIRRDAALDDANTNLFNRLIRDVAENSQVIMITHNKSTMEVADTLFGVTMQKQGISSLVSVNLN